MSPSTTTNFAAAAVGDIGSVSCFVADRAAQGCSIAAIFTSAAEARARPIAQR
eukprot:CAMPEP_0204084982 /NCGR_PEP_ID=MMETSP0360-20130528/180881_1 /ASSEMBLY_ACC=CAM_ASM_000342 /TAXON_ID=268821 /ORGANISM="Scrippsiella Hangoei, Strain SHTV-5" /LENGTH=52 /DNA_ID=CAMNT_0051034011 /DNA_START=203 /DNA_END=357 /DNA_ORIENTATION=-